METTKQRIIKFYETCAKNTFIKPVLICDHELTDLPQEDDICFFLYLHCHHILRKGEKFPLQKSFTTIRHSVSHVI